jgi:hypothetical protein
LMGHPDPPPTAILIRKCVRKGDASVPKAHLLLYRESPSFEPESSTDLD